MLCCWYNASFSGTVLPLRLESSKLRRVLRVGMLALQDLFCPEPHQMNTSTKPSSSLPLPPHRAVEFLCMGENLDFLCTLPQLPCSLQHPVWIDGGGVVVASGCGRRIPCRQPWISCPVRRMQPLFCSLRCCLRGLISAKKLQGRQAAIRRLECNFAVG